MNLHSLTDVPDEFPPTNPVEKPEVESVDEFPSGGRGIVHHSLETRMDRRGPGGPGVDESVAVAHPARNVPDSSTDVPSVNINLLTLDLGTHTGYAVRRRDGTIVHGTQDFTPRASWSPGQRWQRFRSWLSATITENHINQIAFEDVLRHGPNQMLAAHAYGAYRAMMEMVADAHNIELVGFGVGQIKKFWTGAGNAKKDAMIAEARARGFRVMDDNNADALAILHLAVAREAGAWKPAPKRPKVKKTSKRPQARAPSPDLFGAR